ncbi:MAG: hypothetical protein QNJ50_01870 [Mastigocoleus sp. MO_188.B34]|nr:hypothetical protein [Mastigocoleus sp. MO_188.B34]
MKTSEKRLPLPKPDPANIKVLTSNLPKNPILPWNQFDSPWLDGEESEADTLEETKLEEEADALEEADKKEDDPDESVITENVQSNSSSGKQSNQDLNEEQPQIQPDTDSIYPNPSVNTDEDNSKRT